MLQNLSVGPPLGGATDLRTSPDRTGKDLKGSGSEDSFGKALEGRSSPKEPKEKKDRIAEPTVAKPEGKVAKKATVRQQAIQDFMDSFESEFKIPPTRLVEAMAQLTDTELTLAPEETAQAVVSQLGLEQEDSEKAQAMYASLLMKLNEVAPVKSTPEFTVGVGLSHQNAHARIMSAQDRQDLLGASVDRINEKFWNTKATAMPLQNFQVDEESFAQKDIPPEILEQMQMPTEDLIKELPPHLQGQMKETVAPALLAELAAKHAANKEPGLTEEFQEAAKAPTEDRPSLQADTVVPQKIMTEEDSSQNLGWDQSTPPEKPEVAKNALRPLDLESALSEKLQEFKQKLSGLEGVHGASIKGDHLRAELGLPAVPQGMPVSPAEQEAAVKEIMNQAQYLIKQGGGEMKVEMTPEGMGKVHLKVMLQDGKVNMQMSAETVEAKKAIESSLAELKTSLAAHKLSMENVKVDVVNSTSTDTATQNQTNLNHGQGQHRETRQFWNQFNENFGSQGRKESMMDMPSLKGYGKSRDPLQPIETRSVARKVDGKGSGLNLVA